MVDITAQLSLTPSAAGFDSAAVLGAETADNQAFGDILAGQLAGQPTATPAVDATPALASLPAAPAGNWQPGGNILPGAAQTLPGATEFLPETAPSAVATPAVPIPPGLAALASKLALPLSSVLPFPQNAVTEVAAGESAQTHPANPVHSLIKTLAAAIRGQRQADGETPVADTAEHTTPAADGESAEAAPVVVTADISSLPGLPAFVAATPPPVAPEKAPSAHAARQATVAQATAPVVISDSLPATQPIADAVPPANPAQPAAARGVQAGLGQTPVVETSSVPVLAVSAGADATPAAVPTVPLVTVPQRPAGTVTTARLKVSASDSGERSADRPAATLAALADRTPIADRVLPTAAPIITDTLTQNAAPAPVTTAATAPTVEMPRHDFAALVERLVEARNAATPASTHASINHAEFGQVSLHFQQDGNDLKVGMSSADPGFVAAVQAAMPAERQNMNADAQQRGQSQQSQSQSTASSSSHSNHETADQRSGDAAGQPSGNRQGRNSRGGNDTSNPSQRWTGSDQPQSRGGIFA